MLSVQNYIINVPKYMYVVYLNCKIPTAISIASTNTQCSVLCKYRFTDIFMLENTDILHVIVCYSWTEMLVTVAQLRLSEKFVFVYEHNKIIHRTLGCLLTFYNKHLCFFNAYLLISTMPASHST